MRCLLLCFVLLFCVKTHAANFIVNSINDTPENGCTTTDIGNGCTLREALTAAKTQVGADTITFDSTVFSTPQTVTVGGQLFEITDEVIIAGPPTGITITKHASSHSVTIFRVSDTAKATFANLTINTGLSSAAPLNVGINNVGGRVTIINCTVSGYHDANGVSMNSSYGIINRNGVMTLTNCTLTGHRYAGIENNTGVVTFTNCTLVDNARGIWNNTGVANLTNCTLTNNSEGILNTDGAVTLRNSLIAGNTNNIVGTFADRGFNIIANTAEEAGLDTAGLKDNGGFTQTIALLPGSPAINAGDPNFAPPPDTDQRGSGFDRVRLGRVDVGAFEVQLPFVSINNPKMVLEGSAAEPGSVSFSLSLSAPTEGAVLVSYRTADGAAKAGEDYAPRSGTIMFSPGQTRRSIVVPLIGDAIAELNETFFVDLRPATGVTVNATIVDSRGKAYIGNDDGPGISIDNATSVIEGNSGTTTQNFVVRLSAASTNTITVDWATGNGPATGGAGPSDFITANGTLIFAPGETTKTIGIQVKGDTTVEPNEKYFVKLSRPTFAIIEDSQASGFILNDDVSAGAMVGDKPSQ